MSGTPKDSKSSLLSRGIRKNNLLGTATFCSVRGIEPFLQYAILSRGWATSLISTFGGRALPTGPSLVTNSLLDRLELSPYRAILLAMSASASLKQVSHHLTIQKEELTPAFGATVGVINAVTNSLNSLLFVCAQTSASVNGEHFPQTSLIVGGTLFALGLSTEWLSEIQRARWKGDPANKGHLYKQGLFRLSRHINYFGFELRRTGFAIASGGWLWGAVTAAFFAYGFVKYSIPDLQFYLEKRYGQDFQQYKSEVPYKFVPFVW